ncbi:glycosyltransferase family 1 protein [Planctomycetota bacterium]|nr:glycosyltransferase family 1 protein [Planctomycetota bacterium]
MRMALVTETYPPEVNGVAMTLEKLVSGMLDRQHEIEIVRPRQHENDQPSVYGHLEHVTMAGFPLPKYEGLRFGLPAKKKLLNRWRYRRPDIVHIATEGPLGLTALWAAKKLKIPISSSFHTNFQSYTSHYGFGFLKQIAFKYLRYMHNSTQATIVPSNDVYKLLQNVGFENLHVIGRGVDTKLFNMSKRKSSLRKEWRVSDDEIVCICVSRIAEEKNIPLVIEAYSKIKESQVGVKLVLVGDGPLLSILKDKHKDVIFTGMQCGEDLAAHYASGDIFLFASITETFGNVVTEAMASGLAVVAYDYAAPEMHITNNTNGITAELNNSDAFIDASIALAGDVAKVQQLRVNASEYAKKLSWHAAIDQFEKVFKSVIASEKTTNLSAKTNIEPTG